MIIKIKAVLEETFQVELKLFKQILCVMDINMMIQNKMIKANNMI